MMQIFHNGIIRTMAEPETVQAVLTDDGSILAVGDLADLRALAPEAEVVDLMGHTLLPAFIDAHSHLSSYAMSYLQVPLEECCTMDEIAERIAAFIKQNKVKRGAWIMAKGYDHNALAEKTHPCLAFVDRIAPENPMVLQHRSGHVGVLNSLALAAMGITAETPAPSGGRIGLENGKLTGYLEENAFIESVKKVPLNSMEEMVMAYRKAQESYAAHGITTIQEGMMVPQMLPLYQYLTANGLFFLDVVGYPMPDAAKDFVQQYPQAVKQYWKHFKIGGYKIVLDGSPQGRTAWMRTPYRNQAPDDYGYAAMPDDKVKDAVEKAAADGMQILAHCNGDAAAAQYLTALEEVNQSTPVQDIRPVMIHAQLLGTDQLASVKRLGVIPSFFVAHVYHWGDTHIRNFGLARASKISPIKSALDAGIRFTFHQDTPVIEPDMLETVWCAVNRVTKAGAALGKDECIDVVEALKAVTIHAAYQYGEEHEKGSIEAGKAADFVLLDHDPVTAAPTAIRDIRVLQTIKEGKSIYVRA